MNAIQMYTKRHSLVLFFVLAYAISWGIFALVGAPVGFPLGPAIAALSLWS